MGDVAKMIAHLREEYKITNPKLLVYCGIMLGITIFLFIIHGALHMEPSIAALIGAAVLLVISRVDIVEMLEHEIEWPTLIFFMMLFIVVAGAEETGLIQIIADWVKDISGGSLVRGHPDDPLGLGHRLGHHRQHSLHGHHAADRGLPDHGHSRGPARGALVGPGPGGLSGRQRDHDRGQRQRGDRGHGRAGRLSTSPSCIISRPAFIPMIITIILCFLLAFAGGDLRTR